MLPDAARKVYCIDSSSLIAVQRLYPLAIFPGIWNGLHDLVLQGRLIAPHEVLRELENGSDDDILQWAREHRAMFIELDSQQAEVVSSVVNNPKYQGLFDVDSETPDADPFVIALAVVRNRQLALVGQEWIVVADEARATPGRKPRIPDVCRDPEYAVRQIYVIDLFREEGWRFPASG